MLCDCFRPSFWLTTAHDWLRAVETEPTESEQWLSYSELQEMNRTNQFQPLTPAVSSRIEAEVAHDFSDKMIERRACAVTDAWVFRCDSSCLLVDQLPLDAMRAVLAPKAWTTDPIRAYYDCSSLDARLDDMLLSPRGFEQTDRGLVMWISNNALKSLRSVSDRMHRRGLLERGYPPPRFAIADCFVSGTFAEIDDATRIEVQAVGLVQTRGLVKVIYGGPGNMLQSHLLSWDNREATVASSVPSVPKRENFRIILAGPMTPA